MTLPDQRLDGPNFPAALLDSPEYLRGLLGALIELQAGSLVHGLTSCEFLPPANNHIGIAGIDAYGLGVLGDRFSDSALASQSVLFPRV